MFLKHWLFFVMIGVSVLAAERVPAGNGSPPVIPAEEILSIHDAVAVALLQHPAVAAASARHESAVAAGGAVGRWPEPELGYGYFFEEIQTRTGPQRHRFSVSQRIPWYRDLSLARDIQDAGTEAAARRITTMKLRIQDRVMATWLRLFYLERAAANTGDALDLVSMVEGVVETGVRTGASLSDLLDIQIERDQLAEEFRNLQTEAEAVRGQLNLLLNRPVGAPVNLPDRFEGIAVPGTPDELRARLQGTNPELAEIRMEILRREASVALSKQVQYPDIMVRLDYFSTADPGTGVRGAGDDPVLAGVSIRLPLDRTRYRSVTHESRRQLTAAILDLDSREKELAAALEHALSSRQVADSRIRLHRHTLIPKSKESLELMIQSFRSGDLDMGDLIMRHRAVLAFELAADRDLVARETAVAEILRLTGELIVPEVAP